MSKYPLEISFREILFHIQTFTLKEMHLEMLPA